MCWSHKGPPCWLCSSSHQGQVKGRENVTSNLLKDICCGRRDQECGSRGGTRPRVQLLCPRAALPAPNWISHPAETPALPWWEAVPGRADGSWIENPWKGRFHQVFPLVVPQSSSRDRQGSGAEHSNAPAAPVLTEGRHSLPNLPCLLLFVGTGDSSFPNFGFHFPKAAAESWPQLCRLDTPRTAHSPGLLCAFSSMSMPPLGRVKAFQWENTFNGKKSLPMGKK